MTGPNLTRGGVPLAIDLCAGLEKLAFAKSERLCRSYASVQQRVTGRTQNPKHISLRCRPCSPSAVARKLRFVCDVQDPRFSAAFTALGQVGEFSPKPFDDAETLLASRVFVLVPLPHFLVVFAIPLMKLGPRFLRAPTRAFCRAISLVRVWRRYVEVLLASKAISPSQRDVCLLTSPDSAGAALAPKRAIFLVWPLSCEWRRAISADQFVHAGRVA